MVKPLQRGEIKSFQGGLITEAPLLQYPDNASQDELNFDVGLDGLRFRRLGFDIEPNGTGQNTGRDWNQINDLAFGTYLWEQVGGVAGKQYLVVQTGEYLSFYDPNITVISEQLNKTIRIENVTAGTKMGLADVGGYLVVVTGTADIQIITYNAMTDDLELQVKRILMRDVFGVQETVDPKYENDLNYRGGLNYQHYYNLFNQGWAIPRYDFIMDVADTTDAVYLGSNKGAEAYPSNSDTVWLGIQERPIHKEDDNRYTSAECFSFKQFKGIRGSSTPAAKGFFIIDAFDRGASRNAKWSEHVSNYPNTGQQGSGMQTLPADSTSGGPQCVADHAGRIFYAGMQGFNNTGDSRSPNYTNVVFFSQLVKTTNDLLKCYQEGDPTSREANDVIDTDGGFLRISDAKNIMAMASIGSKLIIMAENGIWSITGGSDYGFSATNYKVERLSTYGIVGANSVVLEGGSLYYWGMEGIYMVGANQLGDIGVTDITTEKIKTYYSKYGNQDKKNVFGAFDKYRRRISWGIPDTSQGLSAGIRNKILTFDMATGAFFPSLIEPLAAARGVLIGAFTSPTKLIDRVMSDVVTNNLQPVVDSEDNQVIGNSETEISSVTGIKYVGLKRGTDGSIEIFFGYFHQAQFRDWYSIDSVGIDAAAYLLTGDMTTGDAAINKQTPYLTMFFENTERTILDDQITTPSACIGRVQWDFADTIESGRWSREMQFYRRARHRYSTGDGDIYTGEAVLITKNKVRGNGKVFALSLKTEPFNDCRIIGWSFTITANGVT